MVGGWQTRPHLFCLITMTYKPRSNRYSHSSSISTASVSSLNRLPSLVRLLAESRSKGGSLCLSSQDISRLEEVYNQNLRGSILSNCISKVFFSAGDNATADYQSRITARHIVQKSSVGVVISPNEARDSQSLSRREQEIFALKARGGDLRHSPTIDFSSALEPER